MANYYDGTPNPFLDRVRYFDNEFLKDQDFIDEQMLHIASARRHGASLHLAGVLSGLSVASISGTASASVTPGYAYDIWGREIVVAPASQGSTAPVPLPLQGLAGNTTKVMNVYIVYGESEGGETQTGSGGVKGYTRFTQTPSLVAVDPGAGASAVPAGAVLLAQISATGVLSDKRQFSGVTLPSAAATPVTLGWVPGQPNDTPTLAGGLRVTGALSVGAAASISSNLGVGGATQVGGALTVTGATQLNGTLTVAGATKVTNTLTVTSSASVGQGLSVTGNLGVTGGSLSAPSATVTGTATLGAVNAGTGVIGPLNVGAQRVGIGTASPGGDTQGRTVVLDVNNSIRLNDALFAPGRMHLYGTELCYLLHTQGVIVGKEWGGNGNLTVEGTTSTALFNISGIDSAGFAYISINGVQALRFNINSRIIDYASGWTLNATHAQHAAQMP